MTALLAIEELSVEGRPPSGIWVETVHRCSVRVDPGEVVALIGESGAGKTTLALAALGYARPGTRFTGGRVLLQGRDVLAMPAPKRRDLRGREVAYVAQSAQAALNPAIPVGEQIVESLALHGMGEGAARRALDLLDLLDLPHPESLARRYPHQISGGQQQRVMMAMALACRPRLLVLDEPTTALDVTTQIEVLKAIKHVIRERNTAAVYVSHDLSVVAQLADRILVMHRGHAVEEGTTAAILTAARRDYTRTLLAAVKPKPGATPASVAVAMEESPPAGVAVAMEESPPAGVAGAMEESLPARVASAMKDSLPAGVASAVEESPPAGVAVAMEDSPPAGVAGAHPPAAAPVLAVRAVDASYERPRPFRQLARERHVLHGVDLEVHPREVLAVVGESGSGKSTLARVVAGLHPPLAGEVALDGEALAGRARRRSREQLRRIQIVFQSPEQSLNPERRVGEALARPLRLYFGMSGSRQADRIAELLEMVGLDPDFAGRFPAELSGGQRQRVSIARAFAARPDVILCDEVLSALDTVVASRILELMKALRERHRVAYLFISHDLSTVASIADRVAVMYAGRIVDAGPTGAVFAPPHHPYTQLLIGSVPALRQGWLEEVVASREAEAGMRSNAMLHDLPCPFRRRCPLALPGRCDAEPAPRRRLGGGHVVFCQHGGEALRAAQA